MAATGARAAISEGFETGAAGWTSIDVAVTSLQSAAYTSAGTPNPVTHHASGGNPGGYLSAADPSGETFLFDAPPAFLGNLAAYAGGTLSYDVFYTPHYNEWRGDPDVILSNGTTTLFYLGTSNPGIDWTHFSVTLAPGAGWTVGTFGGTAASAADFAAVLSSTTLLRIRAEYLADVAETTGLDNVTLTAVPEPGTWALLAAGLGLVGLSGARRRSR
ncbi:MAG: laminin B domain-containing protein [Burkholderiales bacterium]